MELLADSLVTHLQINHYLTQAMEQAYLAGTRPVTPDLIQSVLAPDLNAMETKLARQGYYLSSLCEVLNAKSSEVKSYFLGQLQSPKAHEFNKEIHKLGIL